MCQPVLHNICLAWNMHWQCYMHIRLTVKSTPLLSFVFNRVIINILSSHIQVVVNGGSNNTLFILSNGNYFLILTQNNHKLVVLYSNYVSVWMKSKVTTVHFLLEVSNFNKLLIRILKSNSIFYQNICLQNFKSLF